MRSLRTLHLRVPRQSQTATALAEWLEQISKVPAGKTWDGVPGGLIHSVQHSKLQARTASWDIAKQMEGGWNATFSIMVRICASKWKMECDADILSQLSDKKHAALLPRLVKYLVVCGQSNNGRMAKTDSITLAGNKSGWCRKSY